jgi:hypothetical protein
MNVLTRKQREALFRVFQRDFPGWESPFKRRESKPCPRCGYAGEAVRVPSQQWRNFRKKVVGYSDGSGCVMIPWRGMWLGVEKDGYTHS